MKQSAQQRKGSGSGVWSKAICRICTGVVAAAGMLGGCGGVHTRATPVVPVSEVVIITATYQTQAVLTVEDAADDACVWVNPAAGRSGSGVDVAYTVIGTDKKRGLMVYAPVGGKMAAGKLSGNIKGGDVMQEVLDGRMNNLEVAHGVATPQGEMDLVFATNRTTNSISVYSVDRQTGMLARLADDQPLKDVVEVYGVGAYEDPRDRVVRVVLACKSGLMVQYEVKFDANDKMRLEEVDRVKVGGQIEGVAADIEHRRLLVGEELVGVWVYDMDDLSHRKLMDRVGPEGGGKLAADVEGVAIITHGFGAADEGDGYVLVSCQSEDRFAVYDRRQLTYLCSIGFAMADGDRVTHTDGIAVCNQPVGVFSRGIVVVQDDNDGKPQNFKVIDVRRVVEAVERKTMGSLDARPAQ